MYSEGDPRVLELNGAFNVGNRGMVEFIEVFKNETEYLHAMITATQEKFVPAPGRHGTVYIDSVIVAHSNEAEWQKFKADHTNEANLDRIVVVKEQAETLFQNYLDHAEAYVNNTKVKDANTREELQPDEGFLKSVEEQIAIIGSAAEGFRQEVIAYLWAAGRRNEKVSYQSYEPLKEAIEKKLMSSVRDISRIITKARTRDEEQTDKYGAMVQSLLENGYCEHVWMWC
ncbi:Protein PrkA [Geodia barretti]|uniref:Protein PrkA n=1 Tax=Geodia barretti TaxID=519541 RepID=A0AA35RJ51_GEOBA|nr:Protein PrkA [Geodia barretti]